MSQNSRSNNKPSQKSSLIHIPLGLYGLTLWLFFSLALFLVLVLVVWRSVAPSVFASSNGQAAQVAGLFGVIPEFASSIGFTHGLADERAQKLERYLIYQGSPMAGHAETFIRVSDSCPMDWALLPAIAGKESAYGRIIPVGSYNAFGWAVYTGQQSGAVFQNWDHAIERVGQGLCDNYIKQGRVTPEQIEQLYTPLSAQTHGGWRAHVTRLMDQIKSWD